MHGVDQQLHLAGLIDLARPSPVLDGDSGHQHVLARPEGVHEIVLQANPKEPVMGILLPLMIAIPPVTGLLFQSGLLAELSKCLAAADDGVPIPFTGGKRIGVGWRAMFTKLLERLVGIKHTKTADEDEDDVESSTALHTAKPIPKPSISIAANDVSAAFYKCDEDNDGFLDYRELRGALKSTGTDVSHPRAAELLKTYDDSPDGRMQLEEFKALVKDLESGVVRMELSA